MTDRIALILGISGQDGAYLARHLIERGFSVHGTSRDKEMASLGNLVTLGLIDQVMLHSATPTDYRSILNVIANVRPHWIFNLAGQSSVGLSFSQPVETLNSSMMGPLNILEAVRFLKLETKIYNACSGECFGNTPTPADEETAFHPRSPYGVGKAAAYWTVANYREAYGLFACSGILFNHESPLRPERFVTQKIVRGAADIAERREEMLLLGNIDVARDFGWAPEYVEAMAAMLDHPTPEDFVIATGETHTLADFIDATFSWFSLKWTDYVEASPALLRPSDIQVGMANPDKAARLLGWQAQTLMHDVASRLAKAEMERRATGRIPAIA